MAFGVLRSGDPFPSEAETAEVIVEPVGEIGAPPLHEGDFLFGDPHVFEHGDLSHKLLCESGRVDAVVAVSEAIFDLCARIVGNHGAAHRELIEVVVGEVADDLMHFITLI